MWRDDGSTTGERLGGIPSPTFASPPVTLTAPAQFQQLGQDTVPPAERWARSVNSSWYGCSHPWHHADMAENGEGRHWGEVHCNPDIFRFNEGVRLLKQRFEPTGCRVVSSMLMRDAFDALVSDWHAPAHSSGPPLARSPRDLSPI